MGDGAEFLEGLGPYPLSGRVRRNEAREEAFEFLQPSHEAVEFRVAYDRAVEHVVAVIVQAYVSPEFFDFRFRLLFVCLSRSFHVCICSIEPYCRQMSVSAGMEVFVP